MFIFNLYSHYDNVSSVLVTCTMRRPLDISRDCSIPPLGVVNIWILTKSVPCSNAMKHSESLTVPP